METEIKTPEQDKRERNVILAIDPGTKSVGFAIFCQGKLTTSGTITLKAKSSHDKLAELYHHLTVLYHQFAFDTVAVEKGFYRFVKTTQRLSEVRAMCMLLAGQYKLDYREYASTSIKKYITGQGHAEKYRVQQAIELRYPELTLTSPDEADAVSLGLLHFSTISQERILQNS